MQLNSSYLYPMKLEIFQNGDSFITERYHQVYQRPYYLYKGVDNRLDVHVKNSDQKSKNMTGLTVVFNIVATESGELVKQKDCSAYDITTGRFYVEFNEQELYDLNSGFYNFSLHTVSTSGVRKPLWGDSQHDARGQLEVREGAYGIVIESQVIDTFLETGAGTNIFESEVVDAKPQFNSNKGLHTFALYMTNYTGDVTFQGTLEDSNDPVAWVDIDETSYSNSGLVYKNISGIWSRIRIKHNLASGTLDKILYRY